MLGNRQRGQFLTINADGKFAMKVPEGTTGAIQRTNKNNVVISELKFDYLKGYITDVKSKDSDFGKQWEFTIVDGEEQYVLNLSYSSNYAKAFLKMLPNVDLSQELEIVPSSKIENGDKKTSLFLKQNDVMVAYAFKKDAPNGMPDRELIKVQGKDTWDYTAQLEWLEEQAQKHLGATVDKSKTTEDEPFPDDMNSDGGTAKSLDDF